MPGAILLDLYNTLVSGGTGSARQALIRSMGTDLGVDPDRYAELYSQTYQQRFLGQLGDLEATVRAVALLAGGAPTPAAVRLAAARRLTLNRRLLWPSAATLSALDELRARGWRLGLVSNCSVETPQLWKSTPLAARFEAVAFSCELGVAKPDPAIYLAACSFLGVASTDCVFVGDGENGELAGAAGLGMAVVRSVEYRPADGSWPRQRISALAELIDLLGPAPVGGPRVPSGEPVSGPPVKSPRSAAAG